MKHYSTYQSQFIEMFKNLPINGKIEDLVERNVASVKKSYQSGDEIEYIDISSIDNTSNTVVETTKYEVASAPSRAQQCVKNGDILVSTVRPINRNIAVVTSNLPDLVASTGFCILRPKDGYREYLLSVVKSDAYTERMCDKASGGLYPAVNNSDVLSYGIHIPNQELAQKVSSIYQQADKSKFTSLKSQFIEMFGTLDEPRVEVKRLRDIVVSSGQYGSNTPATDYELGMPRYIRITDINDDGSLNDDIKGAMEIDPKYKLLPGDIVFARTGATVGKTYMHKTGDAIYAGYLIKYQMDLQKIRPAFLMAYTHSRPYYNWVSKTQKVGAQPNISAAQYDSMPVLVPTVQEQDAFLNIYHQADKSKYIN